MKMTKKLTVFLAALTLSSSMALAKEGGVGNGGVSVVCRDSKNKITTAEVLDIYEGAVRYGRKYDNALDVETKIELAQLKLVKNPSFLTEFQTELAKVRSIMVFIPKGNSLTPTNDAFPKIKKDGCDFEQLANYTDENELLVSQEFHDELDEVNQAALLVHEAIYTIFRNQGDKDSQRSRKLTAQLLAKNANQKVIDEMIGSDSSIDKKVCGLKGDVDERIKNCNSRKNGLALVSRTKEGKEVHKDLLTGLIWSDRLQNVMTHYSAENACHSLLSEVAKIGSVTWRLPNIEEYKEAEKNGIRKALPNMNYWFWSSSVHRSYSNVAWVFLGGDGNTDLGNRNFYGSVRCVAR
jgi:hypothetical protein